VKGPRPLSLLPPDPAPAAPRATDPIPAAHLPSPPAPPPSGGGAAGGLWPTHTERPIGMPRVPLAPVPPVPMPPPPGVAPPPSPAVGTIGPVHPVAAHRGVGPPVPLALVLSAPAPCAPLRDRPAAPAAPAGAAVDASAPAGSIPGAPSPTHSDIPARSAAPVAATTLRPDSDTPAPIRVGPTPPLPEVVADAAAFRRLLAATEAAPAVGLDTETTGLDPHTDRLRTLQLATPGHAWVVDAFAVSDLGPLRTWLAARAASGRRTLLHNAKFDLKMLRAATGGAALHPVAVSDLLLWSLILGCGLPERGLAPPSSGGATRGGGPGLPGRESPGGDAGPAAATALGREGAPAVAASPPAVAGPLSPPEVPPAPVATGHSLAALCARHLGIDLPKEERRRDWSGPLRPEQIAYAARDAWVLLPLADVLHAGLAAEGLLRVAAVEDACVPAVADMEYAGIGFDLPYWGGLTEALRAGARRAAEEALGLLGAAAPRRPAPVSLFGDVPPPTLNLNSTQQLRAALSAAGLEVAGTSEHALKPHAPDHPAVAALLAYKKHAKALQAFGTALPRFVHGRTGRIHAYYHQLSRGAIGRFSCSNPNVQQIPQDPAFRRAFVPGPERRLVVADLSQIELRIMCRLSGDARMLGAYRAGADLHRLTASLLTGVAPETVSRTQRQLAKAVNFGLIYSMSAGGLRAYAADSYGVHLTAEEAETFRRRFFQAYPGIAAFHRRQDIEARRAREVRTLLGRCRRWEGEAIGLPELVNCPDQGTGADILKRAMGLLRPALVAAGADLVASVHDELVVECRADRAEEVREAVRSALVLAGSELLDPVPVEAEAVIGESWAAKG